MLEAHEALPASLGAAPDARHMRRVHAEYHSALVISALRTTFSLDIPSDAAPAFGVAMGGPPAGGLEWRVRLCLLVAVAATDARAHEEGVRLKQLVLDGPRGQWGSSWVPTAGIAPLEHAEAAARAAPEVAGTRTWASFFASTFMGPSEGAFHDGDEAVESEDEVRSVAEGEVDLGAGEEGWRAVRVETVECEVPVRVWPGNTAFRAMEVVFGV